MPADTLYVVLGRVDYEGYELPYGIYSRKELAEARAAEVRAQEFGVPNEVLIKEYDIDMPGRDYLDEIEAAIDRLK